MSTTSSSTNVNIPFGLPEDVEYWSPKAVLEFLRANKDHYFLDDGDIDKIKESKVAGRTLLKATEEKPIQDGLKRGPASQIVDLVEELKKINGVVEPGLKGLLGKRTSTPEVSIDSIKREKLEAGYRETVKAGLDASDPSVAAKPAAFSSEQKAKPTILNGRPFEQTGPPVVLFHPVFGEFLRDMDDQSLVIPDKTYQLTEDFLWASAEFYDDEDARKTTIKKIFGKIWGHIGSANFGKRDCSSDGVLITNINESVAYRMIMVFKNEVGTGGTDPTLQTALYYRGYWSQDDAKSIRDLCCCPTFGVAIAGPWMCILGAVLLDKTVVQPLTPFLPLTATPYDDKHVGRISRILIALGRAFDKLQMFYTVDRGAYQTGVEGKDRTGSALDCGEVYAKIQQGRTPALRHKSTRPYGALLWNTAALGKFHVVIMPYVDHQPLEPDKISNSHIRKNIYADVQNAINLLHSNQYVFADLRNPNILVVRKTVPHSVLIDFDWCGTDGKDTYPLSLSRRILWPEGVQPGGLLRRAHDLIWLGRLRKALKLENEFPDPTASPE